MNRKVIFATLTFLAMYGFLITGATLIALDSQYLVAAMFIACFTPSLVSDYKMLKGIMQLYKGDKF